jgi:hypothetical protein
MARSSSQYLELLHGFLTDWYTQYSLYSTKYLSLYDKMLDTDDSSSELSTAQQTMNRRYDVVPFSGQELVWDATQYAKTLYDVIIGSISK